MSKRMVYSTSNTSSADIIAFVDDEGKVWDTSTHCQVGKTDRDGTVYKLNGSDYDRIGYVKDHELIAWVDGSGERLGEIVDKQVYAHSISQEATLIGLLETDDLDMEGAALLLFLDRGDLPLPNHFSVGNPGVPPMGKTEKGILKMLDFGEMIGLKVGGQVKSVGGAWLSALALNALFIVACVLIATQMGLGLISFVLILFILYNMYRADLMIMSSAKRYKNKK